MAKKKTTKGTESAPRDVILFTNTGHYTVPGRSEREIKKLVKSVFEIKKHPKSTHYYIFHKPSGEFIHWFVYLSMAREITKLLAEQMPEESLLSSDKKVLLAGFLKTELCRDFFAPNAPYSGVALWKSIEALKEYCELSGHKTEGDGYGE